MNNNFKKALICPRDRDLLSTVIKMWTTNSNLGVLIFHNSKNMEIKPDSSIFPSWGFNKGKSKNSI